MNANWRDWAKHVRRFAKYETWTWTLNSEETISTAIIQIMARWLDLQSNYSNFQRPKEKSRIQNRKIRQYAFSSSGQLNYWWKFRILYDLPWSNRLKILVGTKWERNIGRTCWSQEKNYSAVCFLSLVRNCRPALLDGWLKIQTISRCNSNRLCHQHVHNIQINHSLADIRTRIVRFSSHYCSP